VLSETGPPVHVVWTYPANEAHDVPLTFSVSVQFDRFLLPSIAVRGTICMQAATVGAENPALDRCEGAGFAPTYDPVDRIATWTIRGELFPLTRYNVRVLAPRDANDANGIRAFDGAPLEKEYIFAFTTGRSGAGLEPPRRPGFCDVKHLCAVRDSACDEAEGATPQTESPHDFFVRSCATTGNCHGGGKPSSGISGDGFRFRDAPSESIAPRVREWVNEAVVAKETAIGIDPTVPSRNALAAFGRNMPYIDAANPANSYLLYKIILALGPRCPFEPNEESATSDPTVCAPDGGYGRWVYDQNWYSCDVAQRNGDGACRSDAGGDGLKVGSPGRLITPLIEPRIPEGEWRPPAPGEYERLRARIRGSGMPHGGIVSRAEALAISAWIAGGANVEDCP
jgi:hypothetical protein